MKDFSRIKLDSAITPTLKVGDGTVSPDSYYKVTYFGELKFAVGATLPESGTATATVMAATSTSGTSAAAVSGHNTLVLTGDTGGSSEYGELTVDASLIPATKRYIGLKIDTVFGTGVSGTVGGMLVRGSERFSS